jgi:hypothetical protein
MSSVPEKAFGNFQMPTVDDVRKAIWGAVSQMMANCGAVDPSGQCALIPTNPATNFGTNGLLVSQVTANSYQNDNWLASVSPGSTTLLSITVKPGAAVMAIAGFAVETDPSLRTGLPVSRVDVFSDMAMRNKVASAYSYMSLTHIDYPLAYFLLPKPVVVPPGGQVAVQLVSDARLPAASSYVVMMLPPVVLVSQSNSGYRL